MWKSFSPRNQGSDSTRFNSHIEEEIIYIWYAREKEDKTNQARESANETKKSDRATRESRTTKQRETNNETKRAGQGSEGVEHPLTFGYYVNIQIGNLSKERREGWNWNE